MRVGASAHRQSWGYLHPSTAGEARRRDIQPDSGSTCLGAPRVFCLGSGPGPRVKARWQPTARWWTCRLLSARATHSRMHIHSHIPESLPVLLCGNAGRLSAQACRCERPAWGTRKACRGLCQVEGEGWARCGGIGQGLANAWVMRWLSGLARQTVRPRLPGPSMPSSARKLPLNGTRSRLYAWPMRCRRSLLAQIASGARAAR